MTLSPHSQIETTTTFLEPSTSDSSANETTQRSPAQFLRAIFLDRKNKNPAYSLNAFARDLELSSSQVSRLLSGSRAFTLKQIFHIASILNLPETQTQNLVVEVIKSSGKNSKIPKAIRDQYLNPAESSADRAAKASSFYSSTNLMVLQYEVERFKSIAQWYHLAILNLTFTEGFDSDPSTIATRLGISAIEAREAIDRLLHLGLLRRDETGQLKKTAENLYIKTIKSESALRKFHEEMIEKAKNELKKTDDQSFQSRLINGVTFACAPEHIETIKEMINEFQDKVMAYTKPGPHQEIYQFNCQLFSLTQDSSKTGEIK